MLSLLFSMCLSFIENEKCTILRASKLCDFVERISRIGSSSNVIHARCRENDSLSTEFLLRSYSRHTINISFYTSSNLFFFFARYYIALFSPESHFSLELVIPIQSPLYNRIKTQYLVCMYI